MSQESKISISNLNFYYGNKQVIKNFNLEIKKNKILAVFGPANSGTTTLLKSLNRLCDLVPEARVEGKIVIDDKNIYDADVNVTELRRRVGIVFDVPTPLPISIHDNIAYGPKLRKDKSKSQIADLVEMALSKAALWDEVKDRLHTPALRLSGGQQQRLCIARVLALEPEVILLDRPCSSLDPISTSKIEDSLKQLSEQFTIIISPHSVQQAGRIADHVAFMLMGDLIEYGETSDIFSNPRDNRTQDYITGRFG